MTSATDNLRGILLMVLAMAGFALGDVGIKLLAGAVPPGQISPSSFAQPQNFSMFSGWCSA